MSDTIPHQPHRQRSAHARARPRPARRSPTSFARTSASPAPTSGASTGCAARAPSCSTASRCARASCSRCRRGARRSRRSRDSPRRRRLNPLQEALRDSHAFQCGFCTPGFVMQITALLSENPRRPSRRSARRSPATCAAAPATRRSSTARWQPRASRGRRHDDRRHSRAAVRRVRASSARGPAHPHRRAAATSTTSSCPGMLHAAFVRSTIAHAQHHAASTSTRRGRCPASSPSTPATTPGAARARCAAAHDVPGDAGAGVHDPGHRQGPARRRSRSPSSSPRASTSPRTPPSWSRSTTTSCTPVASSADALDPSQPPIFESESSNVLVGRDARNSYGDVDAAFASADRRGLACSIDQHRHQNVPMECRGTRRRLRRRHRQLTVHSANQGVAPREDDPRRSARP